MANIKDMLHERFLKSGDRPKGAMKLNPKTSPEISGEKPPEPIKIKRQRGLNDVFTALQAQKVYNPNMPSVPAPPPANTFQRGTAAALDNSGAWGGPAQTGER